MSRGDTPPLWRRYLRLIRPDPAADVDDELAFHIAMRVERNTALGMSAEEARRDALLRFGDVARVRHELVQHDERQHATTRRLELMSDFLQDIRFGLRSLRREHGDVQLLDVVFLRHLYILPATAWDEKLAFRDALRADPALATAYATEKWRVAETVGWDKGAYSLAKGPFIQGVLRRLRETGRADIRSRET